MVLFNAINRVIAAKLVDTSVGVQVYEPIAATLRSSIPTSAGNDPISRAVKLESAVTVPAPFGLVKHSKVSFVKFTESGPAGIGCELPLDANAALATTSIALAFWPVYSITPITVNGAPLVSVAVTVGFVVNVFDWQYQMAVLHVLPFLKIGTACCH